MAIKTVKADSRSGKQIDLAAYRIIQSCQPKVLVNPQPFDVESFFDLDFEDMSGVTPNYDTLPSGVYGVTDSKEMQTIISVEMMEDPYRNQFARSTIGHECGHAFLHVPEFRAKRKLLRSFFGNENGMQLYRQEDIPAYQSPEWQAYRFSAALLMPEKMIHEALKQGASTIEDLRNVFDVSVPFVRNRLKGLKIWI